MNKEKLKEISMKLVSDRDDFFNSFRKNLFMYVDEKDITMVGIANEAGMPANTLNNFLYGKTRDMNVSNVVKLSRALNISMDELVGAETIPDITKESIQMCRNLPENDLYLVRWFIRYLNQINMKNEPNKRYVSVMIMENDNEGNLRLTSNYRKAEITNLEESFRCKIFFGICLNCDNYMPHYCPTDILLIANDRMPKLNENAVIRVGKYIYIAKRKVEKGIAKYYSIRDGKYRIDESGIDELIGYIAYKK